MSMQMSTLPEVNPGRPSEATNRISGLSLQYDGTLRLEHFASQRSSYNLFARTIRFFKYVEWELLIAPLFLLSMTLTIAIVPSRWLRYKQFFRTTFDVPIRFLKRGIDVLGASFGLAVSSFVCVVLAILIKLDSKGGVFYKQYRIGRNRRRKKDRRVLQLSVPVERRKGDRRRDNLLGAPFRVYKFRSMKQHAEKRTGPIWATDDDPRITNVGKVLRPYHLDELPQFINVLKGEMSLVGPRPERPEFVSKLKNVLPDYEKRFNGKPGITGLAQVTCGYDTTIEDVSKKLKYDLQYLNGFHGMTEDFKILWYTLKKILRQRTSLS